jgi:hypothetical protein
VESELALRLDTEQCECLGPEGAGCGVTHLAALQVRQGHLVITNLCVST